MYEPLLLKLILPTLNYVLLRHRQPFVLNQLDVCRPVLNESLCPTTCNNFVIFTSLQLCIVVNNNMLLYLTVLIPVQTFVIIVWPILRFLLQSLLCCGYCPPK